MVVAPIMCPLTTQTSDHSGYLAVGLNRVDTEVDTRDRNAIAVLHVPEIAAVVNALTDLWGEGAGRRVTSRCRK